MKSQRAWIVGIVLIALLGGGACANRKLRARGAVDAPKAAPGEPSAGQGLGPAEKMPPIPPLPPEPRIPPAGVTLMAAKASLNGNVAAADEAALDTERIQAAINACPPGRSVKLQADGAKNAFVSGPLIMADSVSLWIDGGVTLFASRDPRVYDNKGGGSCGTDALDDSNGCKPLIFVNGVTNVGIMGDGIIDGRGGEKMLGSSLTWWDVAQHAKPGDHKHSNPRLIEVKKAQYFTLYKVRIFNGPKFHVVINADHYVVWGVKVLTPSRTTNSEGKPLSPHYARNTDGIDPSAATDGVIAYSEISTGDDQIAVKAGDQGETSNLIVAHMHFGTGHGMSIGSETNGGVSGVRVYDLSIDGDIDSGGMPKADENGIRIKSDPSKGGLVTDVVYTDVCMRDLANPILLSPHYSKATGTDIPDYKNIILNNVRVMEGSRGVKPVVTLMGYDARHVLDVSLDNVVIEGAPPQVKSEYADVKTGPGPVSFDITGERVTITKTPVANVPPNPCTGKWVKIAP